MIPISAFTEAADGAYEKWKSCKPMETTTEKPFNGVRVISKKKSDFEDIKLMLEICGPRAKRYGAPFKRLMRLFLHLLYNFPEITPEDLAKQIDAIFYEIYENQGNDWFYRDWVEYDRRDKNIIEICKFIGEHTKLEDSINYEDAAATLTTPEVCNLAASIFLWYQNGSPAVLPP